MGSTLVGGSLYERHHSLRRKQDQFKWRQASQEFKGGTLPASRRSFALAKSGEVSTYFNTNSGFGSVSEKDKSESRIPHVTQCDQEKKAKKKQGGTRNSTILRNGKPKKF